MKTNGWPLPWNNNKESSLKCYSEYILKYLLRFPRRGFSWQELRKKGLVSFGTSLMSLIDFLIFLKLVCREFNFRKEPEKKFRKIRGPRDIPILPGALFYGRNFLFPFFQKS